MNKVYLSLGSNLGNREENLNNAITSLHNILENLESAPFYETSPQVFTDQPDFLNTVISGQTLLSPPGLLDHLLEIENLGGRYRSNINPKGPRTIDIDILLWEDLVATWSIKDNILVIPHPSMHIRRFVLIPLLKLNSALKDPSDGILWSKKAADLTDQVVMVYDKE